MHKRIVPGFAGRTRRRAGRSSRTVPAAGWTLRCGHSGNGTTLGRMSWNGQIFGNELSGGATALAAGSATGGIAARLDAAARYTYPSNRAGAMSEPRSHKPRSNDKPCGRPNAPCRRHDRLIWQFAPRFNLSTRADGCSPNATASRPETFTFAATGSPGRGNIAIARTGHAVALIGHGAEFLEPRPIGRRCWWYSRTRIREVNPSADDRRRHTKPTLFLSRRIATGLEHVPRAAMWTVVGD